jgi:gliding motility-associated-like protein
LSYLKKILLPTFFILITFLTFDAHAQVEFIQNKGQWDKKVNFRGDFSTGSFFLEKNGFTVLLNDTNGLRTIHEIMHGTPDESKLKSNIILNSFAYNVTLLGASANAVTVPDKPIAYKNNYFIGNDESKWATDCSIYNAVTYKNIYPKIDLRYFSTADKLKYEFIVHPGGNPDMIAMRYDGGVKLSIKNKELIVGTPVGTVKELEPYTYQTGLKSTDVNSKFVLRDNVVHFNVDKYDPNATLVIDPTLIFSVFTGSTADNWGYTATPGPDGSLYAGGIVFGPGYPATTGTIQTSYGGGVPEGGFPGYDIGITKFSPSGGRVYATYLGGSANEQPHSLIVDASGNLIVAGRSNSANYPQRTNITSTGGNYDIIITKLNAAGNGIIGSVKMGGSGDDGVNIRPKWVTPLGPDRLRRNYGDDARSEVILDAANNIILSSCTQSSNFPVLLPVQANNRGGQDGVIIKVNNNVSSLLFSTYYGGSGDDACFVGAVSPVNGNLYIGGSTLSNDLLGNTAGTIGPNFSGQVDGFVTQLNASGTAIVRTSYFGTSAIDLLYGLKFDRLGFPYIMGTTRGAWPILNAGYSGTNAKQFISKLQPNLSSYVYSTTFGTSSTDPNISPIAFLVDRCENVYVSGWGGGLNSGQSYSSGNTNGMPSVNPLANIPPPDGADFYLFVLRKDATSVLFGSHFGQFGGTGDHADGGTSRFDDNGVIYQAICANCGRGATFPTTGGSQNGTQRGCNQISLKIDMNFAGVGAEIQSEIEGQVNDTLGCVGNLGLPVTFRDLRANGAPGVTFYWNFDVVANPNAINATTTVPEVVHTFTAVGTYRVRLISEDLSTCNLRDTSFITIRVGDNKVRPNFSFLKRGACTSTTYDFTNLSTNGRNVAFLPNTFVWDYGDGSVVDTTSFATPVFHTYPGPGTYNVKLTVVDDRFCNSPADTTIQLRIASNVRAIPNSPNVGCAPYTALFENNSEAGISWQWEFYANSTNPATLLGTSTDFEPTFTFPTPGTYSYRLIAIDLTTCNLRDTSAFFTIEVLPKPQASGNWAPNPPEPNVPVRFSNTSLFASSYLWDFGDGETSTQFAPVHEYNATGFYDVKLIAFNRAGCTDTFPLRVNVIVNPLLDVPNAFTPGRFGINSVINVRGFGIGKLDWKIYNRWGQVVFRSDNKRQGWDGTFRGKLMPVDTYTYTLDAEFTDGQKLRKTGDITLLR